MSDEQLMAKLRAPFPDSDIEWRISQCGKMQDGKIWAQCLAYIQSRAVMDRLDEVVGPQNWKVNYTILEKGVICSLSICIDDADWVEKQDGAEMTEIEAFKGGISSALKRAGSVWGIGRYLYNLEAGFAKIVEKGTSGALYGKTKEGTVFYWLPPALPKWALPQAEGVKQAPPVTQQPAKPIPNVVPKVNAIPKSDNPGDWVIPFGKYKGKTFDQIGPEAVDSYIAYLKKSDSTDQSIRFIERANHWFNINLPSEAPTQPELPGHMQDEIPF